MWKQAKIKYYMKSFLTIFKEGVWLLLHAGGDADVTLYFLLIFTPGFKNDDYHNKKDCKKWLVEWAGSPQITESKTGVLERFSDYREK